MNALMPEKSADPRATVVDLELSDIDVNVLQPRQDFNPEKLQDLVNSIKEKGVIQPILVRPKQGGYELIAGERRFRAAKQLGFTQIPVVIKDVDDAESLQLALIENIQREELNPLEEAQAYEQLVEEFDFAQEKIAKMVGKTPGAISNTLRLLKLPPEIQTALRKGLITMGHARTMLAVKGMAEQGRLFQRAVTQKLSVRELEGIVSKRTDTIKRKKSPKHNPYAIAVAEELQKIMGTKVKIIPGRKRGKIVLEYYSLNDLDRILRLFKKLK